MKIATWNVNSIRARHDSVIEWLKRAAVDVLCMQETKVADESFPTDEFHRLGYEVSLAGQRTYNGVAIASRLPIRDVAVGLTEEPESSDRRLIAATIDGLRILSVYVPNGKNVESPNFEFKLEWLAGLKTTLERQSPSDRLVVCGDFNIAREARDVYDPELFQGQLHFHPREHAAFDALTSTGLIDAFRLFDQRAGQYSWWDYRAGAFRLNRGLRIDYVLVSNSLKERCRTCFIDTSPRGGPKPSDHAPVVLELV